MNWKQLADLISTMSKEQQDQPVCAVTLGDVYSGEFTHLGLGSEVDEHRIEELKAGQPFLYQV